MSERRSFTDLLIWLYYALAGICLIAAVVQWRWGYKSTSASFRLQMKVLDVYTVRSRGSPFTSVDGMFILVSAELDGQEPLDVSYILELIQHGKSVTTEWAQDIDKYVRASQISELVKAGDSRPRYLMDVLPTHFSPGQRTDGWVHFKFPSMYASTLRKSQLRLSAKSKHGASICDRAAESWPTIRKDFKIEAI